MDYTSYGKTISFGGVTYSVSGCSSPEEAKEAVFWRAFQDGYWRPRRLREKRWQIWRPVEHSDLEKAILLRSSTGGSHG